MVKVKEDLTGRRFGRLIVIEQAEDYVRPGNGQHQAQWLVQCDCGSEPFVVAQSRLKSKETMSCGCYRKEISSIRRRNNRKSNTYSDKLTDEYGEYYIGKTSNTNRDFYVNAEDYDLIKQYCWRENISNSGYSSLCTTINGKRVIMMHLFGYKNYDHADMNALNNRRYNLRPATDSENSQNQGLQRNNTSGYIGVGWNKTAQKWYVTLQYKNEVMHFGSYVNKDEAIVARLKAEKEYCGEFAPQRHLFDEYNIE